ncbi:MAG: DUF3656 domain-containing protein [Oscillospiraceae bacterium]
MPEILAPAGSPESLTAALRCGADAVYIGGKSFSARQNASNFSPDEIKKAAELCHLYNAKLHIALNTIIFDSQLDEFCKCVRNYALAGADAFIIQDIGAVECIRNICPDIPLHASTQMTIHTVNGAIAAKKLGFQRVVLSRELSLEQIKEISALDIETEVFVHGALCMSVSGQCYMSAMIGSRSANRGLCAQPCRLPFTAKKGQDFYALSLKDLCLAEHIKELTDAGVDSFKIEGRMKRPEYVAAAVTEFRKACDGISPDTDTLRAVFSRNGFTDGYFTGKRQDMFGIRMKDDVVSAESVLPSLAQLYRRERKCDTADFSVTMKKDMPVKVTISDRSGNSAEVSGDIPQTALNRPTDISQLSKQFSKLGDTIYEFGNISAETDDGIMLPASSLNQLRRDAVSSLNSQRIKTNTPVYSINHDFKPHTEKHLSAENLNLRISVRKFSQLNDISENIIEKLQYIALPYEEAEKHQKIISDKLRKKIILIPERFISDEKNTEKHLETLLNAGFSHLMCSNIAYTETGRKFGFTLHGDFGLNISNSYSIRKYSSLGLSDAVLSPELKINQINRLDSDIPLGVTAYGRLPLMLTVNCPVKNQAGCGKCTSSLTDRTGRNAPVLCRNGYSEIFNPEKIYMADRLDELHAADFLMLVFTDETSSETADIIQAYLNKRAAPENITRGLLYRGVN